MEDIIRIVPLRELDVQKLHDMLLSTDSSQSSISLKIQDCGIPVADADKKAAELIELFETRAEQKKTLRLNEPPVTLIDLFRRFASCDENDDENEGQRDRTDDGDGENVSALKAEPKFLDPFLGMERERVNYNSFVSAEESMKLHKAQTRAREKQLKLMRQWEKAKVPLPSPLKRHGEKQLAKLHDIVVPTFSIAVGGRELLKDATLRIIVRRRYGLVGRNGIGKTSLLSALARMEVPGIDRDITFGCVEQEFTVPDGFTALQAVLSVDEERTMLLAEATKLQEQHHNAGRLTQIFERLEQIDSSRAETDACSILAGLGFSEQMMRAIPASQLSGGWRMRVILARVLFSDPDVLCLDEPTNHLDIHAVAWLSNFLKASGKTIIVVSHARNFLNEVCTDTIEFKDQKLGYYNGNYDVFETLREDKLKLQKKQFESQQTKIQAMQKFIDKNKVNANTAARAQSRMKQLAKLKMIDAVTEDPSLKFSFPCGEEDLPAPLLTLQGGGFGYTPEKTIFHSSDLTVDTESRIAICGANGTGKSTILKILVGQLEINSGTVSRHTQLRIGYFEQHHLDNLDLTLNAVQTLQERYPEADLSTEQARAFLGRFGITGPLALEPLFILSGGQKSRVAIALTAFVKPHILILDEPTNHLDLDAVQALIVALNSFEGGIVLVSHDAHLLSCVVDDVYYLTKVDDQLKKFKGDFEEYFNAILKTTSTKL